jgi:mRNA interferase MazF
MRPAVVISGDRYNASAIATVVVAVITSNLRLEDAPGNVTLGQTEAGLPKRSVINVTQIATADKRSLIEQLGQLSNDRLDELDHGLRRSLALQ